MTTSALPLSRRAQRITPPAPTAPRIIGRTLRVLGALVIIAASVAAVLLNDRVREFEAWLASWALTPLVPTQLSSALNHYFIRTMNGSLYGLEVTIECTALVIGIPLSIIAAIMLATTRANPARVLIGFVAMWIIVIAVNMTRLALIGWATYTWELDPGYEISHVFVGSVVGILGYALGLAALFLTIGIRPRLRRGR